MPAGNVFFELAQLLVHAPDGFDHIGAGLALDVDDHRWLAVEPAADLVVLQPVENVGDGTDRHRRAIAIGDHHIAVSVGRGDLIVGRDRVGLLRTVKRAFRPGDIGGRDGAAQVFEAEPVGMEPHEIGLDAHRRPHAAFDGDVADAGDLTEFLCELRIDEIRKLARRIAVGRERDRQNWRVRRVHLRIDGRVGQVAR